MLRVAILEKEQVAKDIIFELAKVLEGIDWGFAHFTKISEFAKAEKKQTYDVVFFNEMFHKPRISATFIEPYAHRVVVYTMSHLQDALKEVYPTSRILFIERSCIKQELEKYHNHLRMLLKSREEYILSYNSVIVPLPIQDIFYIEKSDKYVIYHTTHGAFQERKTMSEAQAIFTEYDFIRIHASYLVNVSYIVKITLESIQLSNKIELPIARARKKEIIDWFHQYVKQ